MTSDSFQPVARVDEVPEEGTFPVVRSTADVRGAGGEWNGSRRAGARRQAGRNASPRGLDGCRGGNAMSRRADYPLLVANPDLHYLDSAATSQKPARVLDAIRDFYENDYANPHRGAYALSVRATDRYHAARETIAAFLGVADADCLIFTRGTTESINLVATSIGKSITAGDEIVVTALDHHSNFVPWQQLALDRGARFHVCELTSDGRLDLDCLRSLLSARTRIVA